jgi:hypothetical protein
MTTPTTADRRILNFQVPAFDSSSTTPLVMPLLGPPPFVGANGWTVDEVSVLWTSSWGWDDPAGPPLKYRLHRLHNGVGNDTDQINCAAFNTFSRSFDAWATDHSMLGEVSIGFYDVLILKVEHAASATSVVMPPSLLSIGFYVY